MTQAVEVSGKVFRKSITGDRVIFTPVKLCMKWIEGDSNHRTLSVRANALPIESSAQLFELGILILVKSYHWNSNSIQNTKLFFLESPTQTWLTLDKTKVSVSAWWFGWMYDICDKIYNLPRLDSQRLYPRIFFSETASKKKDKKKENKKVISFFALVSYRFCRSGKVSKYLIIFAWKYILILIKFWEFNLLL